ncbi:MAG: multifunctional CCA addition/repair protein [Gammaproteobacteria bacterium]|nr:multifunctional CCA addition/repair protein [Gammaproteobacteria bacterium]
MKIYQVGGAVRDKLLGKPVKDRDWVVVGATPEQMEALGYQPVGKDFPVFLHPETYEEYALARTERKTGPGYKGFAVHYAPDVTLEDDLRRRDLTINAMAEDTDGRLVDPFGGRADLENKILRHVSPAFSEDPLRVLRVARLATRLNFHIADETLELMRGMAASGELDHLVAERVWIEFERALGEHHPVRFFEVLKDCGALGGLFPELDRLFGVPQPPKHHPEVDTGVHTMLVLKEAARLTDDTQIRFAVLTHDLGKGTTPPAEWPHHPGHEERSAELIQSLCKRYRIPNAYRDLAVLVARFHGYCHRAAELRAATLLKTLKGLDAFRHVQRFEQFLVACEADARGRKGMEKRDYPQAEIFRKARRAAAELDINDLVSAGLTGERMANEIERLQIKAIKQALQTES